MCATCIIYIKMSCFRYERVSAGVSSEIIPWFETDCPFSVAWHASHDSMSSDTRDGIDRTSRGLPAACYESCQSPEYNRYRGPKVSIGPIRSAPPRACRRPGRFIMLISPKQERGSTYFPLDLLPPFASSCRTRSCFFLLLPLYAARTKQRRPRDGISRKIGLVS